MLKMDDMNLNFRNAVFGWDLVFTFNKGFNHLSVKKKNTCGNLLPHTLLLKGLSQPIKTQKIYAWINVPLTRSVLCVFQWVSYKGLKL